jgi:hypothetical protein
MEKAERRNDTGTVHQIARRICIDGNKKSPPVNSIIDQLGNTINDNNEQGWLVSEYFGKVYEKSILDDKASNVPEKTKGTFTIEEITNALEEINWKKAMGPDLLISLNFDTEDGWKKMIEAVHEIMNLDIIPEYLREGDLFILSKNGIDTCMLKEIRPIVLLCFITKVMAKTLLNRAKKYESFKTGIYQKGFKQGMITVDNTSKIIGSIFGETGNKKKFYLLVDQEKAFDRVLQKKWLIYGGNMQMIWTRTKKC